jgi:hypothetical protein
MASERDLELLDDYIGNRLSDSDKAAFEGKLQADPELQRELNLQQQIVASLRHSRAAELKQMLNNIPPSAIPADVSSAVRWSGAAIAVVVAVGLYFYFQPFENDETKVSQPVVITPSETPSEEPASEPQAETPPVKEESTDVPARKPNVQSKKSAAKESEPAKPGMDVYDPNTEESTDSENPGIVTPENGENTKASGSDIVSEIVSNNKNYGFHYQFKDDKLILYGSFDKNLYEIMEFISDNKRTIFLSYKQNFYLLNQAGEKVKPLSPVNDPALIQKLKEYQSK